MRLLRFVAAILVASCAPSRSSSNVPSSNVAAANVPSATTTVAAEDAQSPAIDASASASDASTAPFDAAPSAPDVGVDAAPKGPAKVGEVCRKFGAAPGTSDDFERKCAPGLVCCVPPHGAVLAVSFAYCRAPCKPTKPTSTPMNAGCGNDGCPWALVP